MSRSGLSDQLGGQSWYVILGLGKTIFDDQVSSIDPAMASQAVKECGEQGRRPFTNCGKAKPTTCPLRPRTPWKNEQCRSSRN